MARAIGMWFGLSALGFFLVALLPEHWLGGTILFRLSDRHGPSMADAIGLALVFAGWVAFLRALWVRRSELEPRWAAWLLAAVAVIALCGCLLAFITNHDGLGAVLGLMALAAQLAIAYLAPTMRR